MRTIPASPVQRRRPPRRDAFTLVEMLVVMAIVVTLLSILMPSLERAEDAGKAAVCGSNLRQIMLAQLSYHSDHFGAFVPMKSGSRSFSDFLMPYVNAGWEWVDEDGDGKVDDSAYGVKHLFRCPNERTRTKKSDLGSANKQQLDYGLNAYGRYNDSAAMQAQYHPKFDGLRLTQIRGTHVIWSADADPGSSPEDIGGLSRSNDDRTWPLYHSFDTRAYIRHALKHNVVYLDGGVETREGYEPAFEAWFIPKVKP